MLVLGTSLLALGCNSDDNDAADSPVSTMPSAETAGFDAGLIEGTLALRDGCVVVEADDGPITVPIFDESQVEWNADDQTLTIQGQTFEMDTRVALAGGGGQATDTTLGTGCDRLEDFWRVDPNVPPEALNAP